METVFSIVVAFGVLYSISKYNKYFKAFDEAEARKIESEKARSESLRALQQTKYNPSFTKQDEMDTKLASACVDGILVKNVRGYYEN